MLDAILCKITMNNGLLCVQAVGQPAKILMDTSWSIIRADAVQPILSFGQHITFLAVHNRSIGDLVRPLLCLTKLTISVFTTTQSDPRDL